MKKLLLIPLLIIFMATQADDYDSKVKWYTNYDEVVTLAKKENKNVLVFFHGSDWCPPCIKMQREVFASDEFVKFSSDKLLFLDIDFPRKKQLSEEQMAHNVEIKKRFGLPDEYREGYPQVALIDSTGKVLYQEKGYTGGGPLYLMDKIKEAIEVNK